MESMDFCLQVHMRPNLHQRHKDQQKNRQLVNSKGKAAYETLDCMTYESIESSEGMKCTCDNCRCIFDVYIPNRCEFWLGQAKQSKEEYMKERMNFWASSTEESSHSVENLVVISSDPYINLGAKPLNHFVQYILKYIKIHFSHLSCRVCSCALECRTRLPRLETI